MVTRRKQPSSGGDTFSFPTTPRHENQEHSGDNSDFEFDSCFTPDSIDTCKNSPADHLFFNGKLLPHAFPFQPNNNGIPFIDVDHSNRTSRTSSINSKDSLSSLMSSRSNSTNSRISTTSSCTSARTSSSDNYHHRRRYDKTTPFGDGYASQRWQFITSVPSLSREASVDKKKVESKRPKKGEKKRKVKRVVSRRRRICRRFFRWLVSACVKFHAMEPSKKSDAIVDHIKHGDHVKPLQL